MTLVERVRNICVSPVSEWAVIERETTSPSELVVSYLVPLAALGAVAGLIGSTLLASMLPVIRPGFGLTIAVVTACAGFVLTIAACFAIGWIINALAPTFNGTADSPQAFKLAVYAYTPVLVAALLAIIPIVGGLFGLVGWVYSLYLIYLGLPPLMKVPADKAVPYTLVILVTSIVLGLVMAFITTIVAGLGLAGMF